MEFCSVVSPDIMMTNDGRVCVCVGVCQFVVLLVCPN
jgi:hypothetical protein